MTPKKQCHPGRTRHTDEHELKETVIACPGLAQGQASVPLLRKESEELLSSNKKLSSNDFCLQRKR